MTCDPLLLVAKRAVRTGGAGRLGLAGGLRGWVHEASFYPREAGREAECCSRRSRATSRLYPAPSIPQHAPSIMGRSTLL
jgi:hypothetical protein